MSKIKLLYDSQLLTLSGRTGLYRVADNLLKTFVKSDLFDVTMVGPSPVLPSRECESLLFPQWRAIMEPSRIAPVSDVEIRKCRRCFQKFDAYFSPFFPIPDVVHQAGLITGLFVHDMIPVFEPQYASDPVFVKRYRAWMKHNASDFVAVNSKWTEQEYLRFRPDYDASQMVLSYLGVDAGFFPQTDEKIRAVRQKYKIPNQKYFLSVCEITTRKNLSHLLKAFVRFLKETGADDVCLVLTGPARTAHEELFQTIASFEKYRHKIIQTGFADDADMPALYSGAMGFAYLSLSEGFGLPILEAMACGAPVLSANKTSLPEVGGPAALYVSGENVRETQSALLALYRDLPLRTEMRQKGFLQAQNFSWEKTSAKIMGKYLSLMADAPPGR